MDPDREQRYAELFEQLDLNKDGRVDISELKTGLAARGLHQREAEEIVLESDINHDGLLDFQEFSQYLRAHEKRSDRCGGDPALSAKAWSGGHHGAGLQNTAEYGQGWHYDH